MDTLSEPTLIKSEDCYLQSYQWSQATCQITPAHHCPLHKCIMLQMESNSTRTWTLTCSITQEAMHVHKIEHTCLWGSCLIIVSAVLSHSSTQMQIIVSNLGPHICRVLQRTRPHQEHVSDLHTTVGAFLHASIATHPSALKCARRTYALAVPNPHNQALADT